MVSFITQVDKNPLRLWSSLELDPMVPLVEWTLFKPLEPKPQTPLEAFVADTRPHYDSSMEKLWDACEDKDKYELMAQEYNEASNLCGLTLTLSHTVSLSN